MTLYQFITLEPSEQANATWAGSFIDNRIEGEFGYNLYHLGEFYVEVCYHIADNRIERFKPFKRSTALDPYLENVQLQDLM